MSNVFSCVGRVGKDAGTREVGNTTVTNFSVANNVGFGKYESTMWLSCSFWGKRGEGAAPYLMKGKEVFVSGELSQREYDGKIYMELNCNNVDFVGSKGGGSNEETNTPDMTGDDVPF